MFCGPGMFVYLYRLGFARFEYHYLAGLSPRPAGPSGPRRRPSLGPGRQAVAVVAVPAEARPDLERPRADRLLGPVQEPFVAAGEGAAELADRARIIHEIIEARDVRMGMFGMSNQVSHHIPYMYNWTGQQSKTAEKVREILRPIHNWFYVEGRPENNDEPVPVIV